MEIVESDILLVEDDAADAILAAQALHRNRLANRIQFARDGKEALDFVFCRGAHSDRNFNHKPLLILLDLKLPEVDGIEVLRQLRFDPRTAHIPVIVLTSSKAQKDILQSSLLGINGYILKPVSFDQFHDSVRRLAMSWVIVNAPAREPAPMEGR